MKFIIILILFIATNLYPQYKMFETPLSERIANYTMKVDFDPDSKKLFVKETIRWKNTSSDYVASIHMHLYLNALKHENTTLLSRSPQKVKQIGNDWGWTDINKITMEDGKDITKYIRFIHPDDSNSSDSTVIAIDLPSPVKPHSDITLNIEFTVTIPRLTVRTGFEGDFFHFSQWFPKLGVYENGEWVCHQYHATGEFYADYGVYDVTITAPSDYTIGSSGILLNKQINNDKTTHHFYCEDIHDFAWSADKDFIEVLEEFEGTKIRLLYQPGHEAISGRIVKAIKTTLDYYGDSYGKYPWPQVTCIESPEYPAVMEYPTLFVTANYNINFQNMHPETVPENDFFLEMLTIHEFGHNWWQGLVANNETKEMWLDESLNSYATAKAMEYAYEGIMLKDDSGEHFTIRDFERGPYQQVPMGVLTKKAWEFENSTEMFVMCYPKGTLLFLTLENYYGEELFGKCINTFYERWRFKHPAARDLLDVIYEVLGNEFEPFLAKYFYTSHTLDYSVASVEGNRAVIRREGELAFPVNLTFELEDGKTEKRYWQGMDSVFNIEFDKTIEKVVIDPDNIIEFDLKKENNFWEKKFE